MDYVIEQYNYAATYSQFQAQLLPTSGSLLDYIGSLLDELANLFQLRVVPDPGAMDPGRDDVLRLRIEDSRSNAVMGYVILDLFARSATHQCKKCLQIVEMHDPVKINKL